MPKGYFNDEFNSKKIYIENAVKLLTKEELDSTSVEEWVNYFFEKYKYNAIEILNKPPKLEEGGIVYRNEMFPNSPAFPVEMSIVKLAIVPNDSLFTLFDFMPSTYDPFAPKLEYATGGFIILQVESSSPENFKKRVDQAKQNIANYNTDIENANAQLPGFIRPLIVRRMEELKAKEEKYNSLAAAIGADLALTQPAKQRIFEAPKLREEIIQLRKPKPAGLEKIKITEEEFNTILSVIDSQGKTFERTPSTIYKLNEEEDLRNIVLGALNAAFDLHAKGEAFSKWGKVDIIIDIPNGGVFIAEAKIWDGEKTINDAITQILGYLTWRDAYGLVVVFSRRKEFSNVQSNFKNGIQVDSLRGNIYQKDEHHWFAKHALPENPEQLVEIHYLLYDISAGNKKGTL